jgi:hypothetical protein
LKHYPQRRPRRPANKIRIPAHTKEAREILYAMKGYRTEKAYGEGYRDAKEVLTHEIKELHNDETKEIAENLGLPKNSKLADIFKEIDHRFGPDAKVLWLATRDGVEWYLTNDDNNSEEKMNPEDIDEYFLPKGAQLIVDMGYQGQLFLMSDADYEKMLNPKTTLDAPS